MVVTSQATSAEVVSSILVKTRSYYGFPRKVLTPMNRVVLLYILHHVLVAESPDDVTVAEEKLSYVRGIIPCIG